MAGATPKWFISYMQATDPVAQVDDINACTNGAAGHPVG